MTNVGFTYDYSFLMKTLKYVLLPVMAIVVVVGFFVFIYSRRSKKDNIEKYNYVIDLWTTLIAIVVVGALLAVTLGFSLSLTNTIKSLNLIEGHELIYYIVLITPIVPGIFLLIYIYKFILTLANKPKNNEVAKEEQATVLEEVEEEKEVVDYNNDFTKFNEYSENKDNTEEIESLDFEDDSNTEVEEVLDLTETEDDEEIELL